MADTDTGSFLHYKALKGLPALVRKQRALEAKLYASEANGDPTDWDGESYVDLEKGVRGEICELLNQAGLTERGDYVTCNGYDVTHRGQNGRSGLNVVKATEQLVAAGLPRGQVEQIFKACTERGDPSEWAEVKPSKGAKVRKAS